MIMMIYTGYEEHITKTRLSHLVSMEDTELIGETKEQPQNQLKTPLSISITDSDLTNALKTGVLAHSQNLTPDNNMRNRNT
jgi:hypothetical protein